MADDTAIAPDDTAIAPTVDTAFAEAEFNVFEPPVVWFHLDTSESLLL